MSIQDGEIGRDGVIGQAMDGVIGRDRAGVIGDAGAVGDVDTSEIGRGDTISCDNLLPCVTGLRGCAAIGSSVIVIASLSIICTSGMDRRLTSATTA